MLTFTSGANGSKSVVLHDVSWQTYELLSKDCEKQNGVRLNFNRGDLQVMTPGPEHEWAEQQVTDVVKTSSDEWDTDVASYGSTTFRREDLERGFEPDSCFYIHHPYKLLSIRLDRSYLHSCEICQNLFHHLHTALSASYRLTQYLNRQY